MYVLVMLHPTHLMHVYMCETIQLLVLVLSLIAIVMVTSVIISLSILDHFSQ